MKERAVTVGVSSGWIPFGGLSGSRDGKEVRGREVKPEGGVLDPQTSSSIHFGSDKSPLNIGLMHLLESC